MDTRMANTSDQIAIPPSSNNNQNQSYTQAQAPTTSQGLASPAPIQYNQYASHTSNYAQTPHHGPASSSYRSTQYDTKHPPVPQPYRATAIPGTTENSVRPHEIFRLSEQANAQIPEKLRQLYQQDEYGNVLFFTAPPVDVLPPTKEGSAVGHTARYLAEKLRRKMASREKRKAEGLPEDYEEPKPKRASPAVEGNLAGQIHHMRDEAFQLMIDQMQEGTRAIYKGLYGLEWEKGAKYEVTKTAQRQAEARKQQAALEESERKRKESETVSLTGTGVYLDDLDPRY